MAAQMRHADPTTTLRVYTQVMQHARQGVAERLDQALSGVSSRKSVANAPETAHSGGPAPDGFRSMMGSERA